MIVPIDKSALPITVLSLITLGVSSCASLDQAMFQSTSPRVESFIEAEYLPYAADGTASVSGEAFSVTRGGDVVRGAGCEVWLWPATAYTAEHIDIGLMNGRQLSPPIDKRFAKYTRKTVADSSGRFAFVRIPAGRYFLLCHITLYVPSLGDAGGWVFGTATVAPGEHLKAIVAR